MSTTSPPSETGMSGLAGSRAAVEPLRITLEAILRAVMGVRDERRMRRLLEVLPDVLRVSQFAMFAETAYPRIANSTLGQRPGALPGSGGAAVHVDSVRRGLATLHRRELRTHGDEDGPASGARNR